MISQGFSAGKAPKSLVFPHWLDAEYASVNGKFDYETILKLCFLLGWDIGVSDIQAWDGKFLPRCFLDKNFSLLVNEHPRLLRLVVSYESVKTATSDLDYAIATRGASRCQEDSWVSSVLSEPSPIKRMAYDLLKDGRTALDSTWIESYISSNSSAMPVQTQTHLQAIHATLSHFAQREIPNAAAAPSEQITYSAVAQKLVDDESTVLDTRALEALNNLLAYLKKNDQIDGIGQARSKLKTRILADSELSSSQKSQLWSTAVHCYNRATQNSLCVPHGLAGPLGTSPICAYRYPEVINVIREDEKLRGRSFTKQFALSNLSWDQIRQLMYETAEKRVALQRARAEEKVADVVALSDELLISLSESQSKLVNVNIVSETGRDCIIDFSTDWIKQFTDEAAKSYLGTLGSGMVALKLPYLTPLVAFGQKLIKQRIESTIQCALTAFYMNVNGTYTVSDD